MVVVFHLSFQKGNSDSDSIGTKIYNPPVMCYSLCVCVGACVCVCVSEGMVVKAIS
jgi:hypothetical protein